MWHHRRAALLAALTLTVVTLACADDQPPINAPDYDRINEDPAAYEEREVTITGVITERLTLTDDFPIAFFVGEYPVLDATLLVVVRSAEDLEGLQPFDLFGGTGVEVDGTLITADEDALADEYGRSLADSAAPFIEDEPGPVLVADRVADDQRVARGVRVSAQQLASSPQEYLGKSIAVTGRVTEQVGAAGYVLDGDAFVARRERKLPGFTEGGELLAVGVVRVPETVEELTRLIGPPGALAPYEGDLSELVGLPVVVATDLWSPSTPPGTLQ